MGLFETVDEMPTEGAIRGLTAEIASEADKAIADGKVRSAALTEEAEKTVKVIKRYLSSQGWGCAVRTVGGRIHWQVKEKREISPEHKEKMRTALAAYRASKEAATNGNGNGSEKPVAASSKKG